MIAEDFGPVRMLATESIEGTTVEGARVRTGPRPARARPAQAAIGAIIDIAVNFVRPKSLSTPTSGLARNAG